MRWFIRAVALVFALGAALSLSPQAAMAKPVRISGVVLDYRAQPVEGATIMLYDEPAGASAGQRLVKLAEVKSSTSGGFDLAAERDDTFTGGRWLIAYKEGLALCWTRQGLGLRPSILRLGRAKPLGGVVVNETGRPVAGAKVSLCVKNETMDPAELPLPGPEDWHTRRTDNEGRFLFENLPADTTADFRIEAPGRARTWTFRDFGMKEGEQFPAGRTDIRITVAPEARIEGTVVDEDTGAPVAGVCVLARPHERAGAKYYDEPVSVDPDGRFILTGLAAGTYLLDVAAPEGRTQDWFAVDASLTVHAGQVMQAVRLRVNRGATLEVVARAPGYNENSVDPVALGESGNNRVELRPIVLQPRDRSISGAVVDGNDKPMPGALVETPRLRPSEQYDKHEDATQPHRQVFTDAEGQFQLDGLCTGPVEITAHTPGPDSREGVTHTSAGERNVKIVLGQTLSFARSLLGTRLPSLADFGLRDQLPGLEGKAILLCLLDVQQRPSRHVLSQLAQSRKELAQRNVALVIVQAAQCEAGELAKRVAEQGREIRCGQITDNAENAQRTWGFQSLPWLILTDRSHVIRAEGFALTALWERIGELDSR